MSTMQITLTLERCRAYSPGRGMHERYITEDGPLCNICKPFKKEKKKEQKVIVDFFSKIQDIFPNNWQVFEDNRNNLSTVRSAASECIFIVVTFYNCSCRQRRSRRCNRWEIGRMSFVAVYTPACGWLTVFTPVMDRRWSMDVHPQHWEGKGDGVRQHV